MRDGRTDRRTSLHGSVAAGLLALAAGGASAERANGAGAELA